MSEYAGGPSPGAHSGVHRGSAGPVPVLLLAAIAAALFIGVTLGAIAMVSDDGSAPAEPAAAPGDQERVRLVIRFEGSGKGKVEIRPGDVLCTRTCTRRFVTGANLVAVAEPAEGSTFEGWGDACDGAGSCSFVIDEDRSLSLTFDRLDRRAALPCDVEQEATCAEQQPAEPPPPRSDCLDGRDNDRDGLTDAAQDPGCDEDNTEADGVPPAAPPPPSLPGDCADGRDNDADGLTDTEQDPDCLEGDTESGTATSNSAGRPRAARDCNDRRDNDGDGLIDTAQDPGCEGDGTEAD